MTDQIADVFGDYQAFLAGQKDRLRARNRHFAVRRRPRTNRELVVWPPTLEALDAMAPVLELLDVD